MVGGTDDGEAELGERWFVCLYRFGRTKYEKYEVFKCYNVYFEIDGRSEIPTYVRLYKEILIYFTRKLQTKLNIKTMFTLQTALL